MTFKRTPISRPWSVADDDELRRLAAMGVTLLRACAALNRRGPTIRKRAGELGLQFVGMREAKRRIRMLDASEAHNGRSSTYS